MTSYFRTSRLFFACLALALVAGACGVSREDSSTDTDSITADAVDGTDDAAASETDGDTDGEGGTDSAPTTEPQIFGADPDEVAAAITFADGTSSDIANGELADAAQGILGSEDFIGLAFGGQIPDSFQADVLTQMIGDRIIEHAYEVAGGSISDAEVEAAAASIRSELSAAFGTQGDADPEATAEGVSEQLGAYFALMVNIRAGIDGLGTALPTEEFPCVSHILVATLDEANALKAELDGGADFATLAQENSTDPGSGAAGGVLGCESPDSWVPEFSAAMLAAEVGKVTEPVESQFGFHLILVTGSEASGEAAAQTALENELTAATVEVDEAIGSWVDGQVVPTP